MCLKTKVFIRYTMSFSLSSETRNLIHESTGLSPIEQVSVPVNGYSEHVSELQKKLYSCEKSRVVSPRGSVYLYLGRILSYKKVKRFLAKI